MPAYLAASVDAAAMVGAAATAARTGAGTFQRSLGSIPEHVKAGTPVAKVAACGCGTPAAARTSSAVIVPFGPIPRTVPRATFSSPARCTASAVEMASGRRFLTMAQLEQLAGKAGEYATLVRVLGYGGLRWGEAVGLTVEKCDLLRSRLIVDVSVVDIAGRLSAGTTKSGRRREVPLSRFLRDELALAIAGKAPEDLVFPAPRGGHLRNSNWRRGCFDKAAIAAGLDGLIIHELRHTAASLAIQSGANIKVVQSMMGHAAATMTWDLYGHLYDDDLDQVAERLDAAREDYLREACGQSAYKVAKVVQIG